MANGLIARLPDAADPLGQCRLVAMAHVGGHTQRGPRNDTAYLAAGLSAEAISEYLPHLVSFPKLVPMDRLRHASRCGVVVLMVATGCCCSVHGEHIGAYLYWL